MTERERRLHEDLEQLAALEGQLEAAAECLRVAHRTARRCIGWDASGRGVRWADDAALRGLRSSVSALRQAITARLREARGQLPDD